MATENEEFFMVYALGQGMPTQLRKSYSEACARADQLAHTTGGTVILLKGIEKFVATPPAGATVIERTVL